MTTLVFVYGSLLKGFCNHRLLERARFLRRARTTPAFTLVDLGAFPGLLSGGATSVHGEVYAVDGETLATLDRLEGHPHFYRRQDIPLRHAPPRALVDGYVLPRERYASYPIIRSGDWRAHAALPRQE